MGVTADGINRELASTLECASFCRPHESCKSLAIPETAILKLATRLPSSIDDDSRRDPVFDELPGAYTEYRPSLLEVARGILPSLRHVVTRDCAGGAQPDEENADPLPDTHPDSGNAIDPFGSDYFCIICFHELANTYFHCCGCEALLAKDFNVCSQCFNEGAHVRNKLMHREPHQSDKKTAMASNFHHVGVPSGNACRCQRAHKCSECGKCPWCVCSCHSKFGKRHRFFTDERQKGLLDRCIKLVDQDVLYATETLCRLNGEGMVRISYIDEQPAAQAPVENEEGMVRMSCIGGQPAAQAPVDIEEGMVRMSCIDEQPAAQASVESEEGTERLPCVGEQPAAQAPVENEEGMARTSGVGEQPTAQAPVESEEGRVQMSGVGEQPAARAQVESESTESLAHEADEVSRSLSTGLSPLPASRSQQVTSAIQDVEVVSRLT